MSTTPLDEAAITAALDFTPECEVIEPDGGKCCRPAAWIGAAPCGHDYYFCDHHHSDQRSYTCHYCGSRDMLLATYLWTRI
jgi:hypothetical protein